MPPRPERVQALGILAATLLAAQLLLLLTRPLDPDPVLRLSLQAAVTEVVLLGLALAGGRVSRRGLRHTLGVQRGRLRARDVGLLALGTLAASHALDGIARWSGASDGGALRELPEILAGARGMRLVAALLAIGLAPAIAEELLCRGLIQRALVRRLGAGRGIVAASIVFGILHVDPVHAVFAALLGIYLGVVARWDDSTRASAICHAVNNSSGVLALGLAGGGAPGASPTSIAAGAALSAGCLLWAARATRVASPPPTPVVPAGSGDVAPLGGGTGLQPGSGSDDA